MPAGIPKVVMFALEMRADMVAGAVVVGAVVDPEAAGADPEGPAAGVVVEGAEAIVGMISVAEEQSATVLYSARCRMLLLLQSVKLYWPEHIMSCLL
jgi:hypothetical protein